MEEKKNRIEELIRKLNEASDAYYNDGEERMSNYEWDQLYDELAGLEAETGYVLDTSPTQTTGAEEKIQGARREAHEFPALSLAKSKDVAVLQRWAGERPIWLSWKLDGLTLVATYDQGKLSRLMTRGNGTTGTNITYLAPYIAGLPARIEEKGHFVVRGEAVISYGDFQMINDLASEGEDSYANPRNLVAGTLALDLPRADLVRQRKVSFYVFTLVYTQQDLPSWGDRMELAENLGFSTVPHEKTTGGDLPGRIDAWTALVRSGSFDLPVDGLVITFDDILYAATGSVTGHHATNAGMAFKWQDTAAQTTLRHVEWSCAASTISPVAVFDPVALEGTQVKRASLCNISEMRRLGIGADGVTTLKVIKANMIIPKCIAADPHGTSFTIPESCPVCGADTYIRTSQGTGTETLHCSNPACSAKQIQKYARFVSKAGMDIDGLSVKTIMKFINQGFLKDFADIYHIETYQDEILNMEGFGEKSFANMLQSVQISRKANPVNFIFALCIPMIGIDAAKKFIAAYGTEGFLAALEEGKDVSRIDGIGPEKAGSLLSWYADPQNRSLVRKLLQEIDLEKIEPAKETGGTCKGLTFVITGEVQTFQNRDAFKAYVEGQGGKVTGSVSKKTDFLVNNDSTSPSAKNRKAKELGIPILTEADFLQQFGGPI